jgi:hypothetical protein
VIVPAGMQDGGRLRRSDRTCDGHCDGHGTSVHFDLSVGWGSWRREVYSVDWKHGHVAHVGERGAAEQNDAQAPAVEPDRKN